MDHTDAANSTLTRPRVTDRVGIVPRLLACSLLAVVLAVAAVQILTTRSVAESGRRRETERLKVAMAVLLHEVGPRGANWSLTADGQLMLGPAALNGRNDLVDTVLELTGSAATIFAGDTRVATTVRGPDGARTIGTRLEPGPVHDAVFRDGHGYVGFAMVLGAPWLASYQPIRDVNGRVIGVLSCAVPIAVAEAFVDRVTGQAMLIALAVLTIVGCGLIWAVRAAVRPLRTLTAAVDGIAEGAVDSAILFLDRTDDIGRMAQAVSRSRDASARVRAREAEATARADAASAQHAALLLMVDKVEVETTKAISEVGTLTAAMTATAEQMAASAIRTDFSAGSAASASAQALENVQGLATATEQLSASIHEIGAQVGRSAEIVGRAVAAGKETRETIRRLNEQVGRIGVVADVIGEIAARNQFARAQRDDRSGAGG